MPRNNGSEPVKQVGPSLNLPKKWAQAQAARKWTQAQAQAQQANGPKPTKSP